MRALSIRQPWAWLIVQGFKPVENRTWSTDYRGPLLIHASKTISRKDYARIAGELELAFTHPPQIPSFEEVERGGVVGVVELVDVVTEHTSPYFTGPFGWVLDKPRPIAFTPCKGALTLFHVPASALPPGAIA